MNTLSRDGDQPPDADRAAPDRARVVEAATLLGQEREVVILHRGDRYRLRLTQSGKLILTK